MEENEGNSADVISSVIKKYAHNYILFAAVYVMIIRHDAYWRKMLLIIIHV